MIQQAIALFLLSVLHGHSWQPDLDIRIVGGEMDLTGQFDFEVSLQHKQIHKCAGSIISPTKILTAAHCLKPGRELKVYAGITNLRDATNNKNTYSVISHVIHPRFNATLLAHDIALITVHKPIAFDATINAIELRQQPLREDEELIVSGWGSLTRDGEVSPLLQSLRVTAVDAATCKTLLPHSRHGVRHYHVCSSARRGHGTCYGDSGGPLIDAARTLVGIVSWGRPCAKGYPDVYTSVMYHYQWIMEHL